MTEPTDLAKRLAKAVEPYTLPPAQLASWHKRAPKALDDAGLRELLTTGDALWEYVTSGAYYTMEQRTAMANAWDAAKNKGAS